MATTVTQKDTTLTKIFVGGLPYHTTDCTLRSFFEEFGDIEEAVVITDRNTGKSRGYGFVTMSDRAAAERACKDPNPVIDGRKANVNLAYLGAKPRTPVGGFISPHQFAAAAALKAAGYPGVVANQFGLPHYVYPTAYGAVSPNLVAVSPHSPLSPTAAGQYFDYSTYAHSQYANGIAAAADPYAAAAAHQYAASAFPQGYTYAAVPQPIPTGATSPLTATYQPQQIGERMQ